VFVGAGKLLSIAGHQVRQLHLLAPEPPHRAGHVVQGHRLVGAGRFVGCKVRTWGARRRGWHLSHVRQDGVGSGLGNGPSVRASQPHQATRDRAGVGLELACLGRFGSKAQCRRMYGAGFGQLLAVQGCDPGLVVTERAVGRPDSGRG
jgi:hypothetical protein